MGVIPIRCLLAVVFAAVIGGCGGSRPPSLATGMPPAPPLAGGEGDAFAAPGAGEILRPKDRLNLVVHREPQLSLENVRIDEDGGFAAPFVGRIRAAGRSTAEVAEDIRARLARDYLVNPQVTVNLAEPASHLVTVEGAVAQPGLYTFPPGTTLLGGIALARGPLRVARRDQVAIFRSDAGHRAVAVFDLDKVRSGEMLDPRLEPGDRIVIGFSGLGQAWLDFLSSASLLALFTRF